RVDRLLRGALIKPWDGKSTKERRHHGIYGNSWEQGLVLLVFTRKFFCIRPQAGSWAKGCRPTAFGCSCGATLGGTALRTLHGLGVVLPGFGRAIIDSQWYDVVVGRSLRRQDGHRSGRIDRVEHDPFCPAPVNVPWQRILEANNRDTRLRTGVVD